MVSDNSVIGMPLSGEQMRRSVISSTSVDLLVKVGDGDGLDVGTGSVVRVGEAYDVLVAGGGGELVSRLISPEFDVHPANETINKKVNKYKCPERLLNAILFIASPVGYPTVH